MKIDLICNDGSPIGVTPPDIESRGVGGAELSMMTLMQTFADRGHDVSVYNDPKAPGKYDGVEYSHRAYYNPRGKRDVLIVFRSPSPHAPPSVAKLRKVWWSTDQYTIGNFAALSKLVDFCITISPFHTKYHMGRYDIPAEKIGHIDLGVRLDEYDQVPEKIKGQMIYCSIPDRGLQILHAAWPLIRKKATNASLVITSDYRLWGAGPNNMKHRLDWAGMKGVRFLGMVNRSELVRLQLESEVHPYPCIYDELFCISVAECQAAGCFPVTTNRAALATTNQFGIKVSGDPRTPQFVDEFADRVARLLTVEREFLHERTAQMRVGARTRFDWNRIAEKWEHLFEEGSLK